MSGNIENGNTIFALSSGRLPCGVAIVRISGNRTRFALETMAGRLPTPRFAGLRSITTADGSDVLDEGLVLWFPGPTSFTGEDCAELHLHGSVAVVQAVLDGLNALPGFRPAEPGEFSRRALENDRLDLVELEGLSDLIAAQTEAQRRQALAHVRGTSSRKLADWREEMVRLRALIEAELDFSDEEDVPGSVADQVWDRVRALVGEMRILLTESKAGTIVRDGFKVALMGKPNSGKSSLLNALAKEEVAIVTPQAGTTRDTISVDLDLGGFLVRVTDTAGIRDTEDLVELEGIRRARKAGEAADLILWLEEENIDSDPEQYRPAGAVRLISKDDSGASHKRSISAHTGHGMTELLSFLEQKISEQAVFSGEFVLSRVRQYHSIEQAILELEAALEEDKGLLDLRAERLRRAGDLIGKVTGHIDVEDLLDVIFAEFCIGK